MKRGTPRHPKIQHLREILRTPLATAVGYLELLWHFTAEFAPQGDIGRYDDRRIEAALGWTGKRGALIQALIDSKWIDLHSEWRLLVHDWRDHADDSTRKRLHRAGLPILSLSDKVTGHRQISADFGSLPEPEPEPEPEPIPEPYIPPITPQTATAAPSLISRSTERKTEKLRWFREEFWPFYWRRSGKGAAEKAWLKAATDEDTKETILRGMVDQSGYYQAKEMQFRPHASTWLNQRRWEDDPKALIEAPAGLFQRRFEKEVLRGAFEEELDRRIGNGK